MNEVQCWPCAPVACKHVGGVAIEADSASEDSGIAPQGPDQSSPSLLSVALSTEHSLELRPEHNTEAMAHLHTRTCSAGGQAPASDPDNEVDVWIVRHGERVDEVAGTEWVKCGKKNPLWFDPALTDNGHLHAHRVARALRRKFDDTQPPTTREGQANIFHAIYTSPLIRTVQTAEKFSAV